MRSPLVLVLGGVGLSAAVIAVRADFNRTDTTQISTWATPLHRKVAADYTDVVRVGEITVASRVSVFRQATRLTVWGAVLTAATFVFT